MVVAVGGGVFLGRVGIVVGASVGLGGVVQAAIKTSMIITKAFCRFTTILFEFNLQPILDISRGAYDPSSLNILRVTRRATSTAKLVPRSQG